MEPGKDQSHLHRCCHNDSFPQFPLPSGNAPALAGTADAGEKSGAVARAGMIYLGIKSIRVPGSLLRDAEIDVFTVATESGGCSRENTSQTQPGIFQSLLFSWNSRGKGPTPLLSPQIIRGTKKTQKNQKCFRSSRFGDCPRPPGCLESSKESPDCSSKEIQGLDSFAIFGAGWRQS